MLSDTRRSQALAALVRPIAEFRTLVRDALTQGEAFLAAQTAGADERTTQARAELGRFAEGHIDPARFAALFPAVRRADPAALAVLRQSVDTLRALIDRDTVMFVADVPPGGQLGDVVRQALAELGRALGAVSLIELVRSERYRAGEHERLLAPVEFPAWNNAARQVAPPLVVTLDGADLHAGALAQFTDGREKIVLVVRGPCAPAPLVRCITPGTLVLQTADGRGLDRVAAFDGPSDCGDRARGRGHFPARSRHWPRAVAATGHLAFGRSPEARRRRCEQLADGRRAQAACRPGPHTLQHPRRGWRIVPGDRGRRRRRPDRVLAARPVRTAQPMMRSRAAP